MSVLIIEDEARSANKLRRMIKMLRPNKIIASTVAGIAEASEWFNDNPTPDLVFLDIELEDGNAFDLLEKIDIAAPIIFCTVFSHYAIRAFKVNSINYLLKPVSIEALAAALTKVEELNALNVPPEAWRHLRGVKGELSYRRRFIIRRRTRYDVIPIEDVIAVKAWLKVCQLIIQSGETLPFDETLKAVSAGLNPTLFFQVSRDSIIRLSEVDTIVREHGLHFVILRGLDQKIQVSRQRVTGLRAALEQ